MTISNFKARVYGFLNRSATLFTTTESASIDQVLAAMNDARRAAQRQYAFELCRANVFLVTSEVGANWMSGCTDAPGGNSVLMRRLDDAWNYGTTVTPAGTVYSRTSQIDIGSSGDFKRETRMDSGNGSYPWTIVSNQTQITQRKFAYFNGPNLCLVSIGTPTSIMLNGIKFLDDLVGTETDDPFMVYFSDWLFWSTLLQLNQFLKDDQRITIDAGMVNKLWESVKQMDGEIANSGDNSSLD